MQVVLVVRRPPPEARRQEGFTVFPVKVRHDLVAEIGVPDFAVMPEVLTWGTRTFVRSTERWDSMPMYVEGMNFVVPVG